MSTSTFAPDTVIVHARAAMNALNKNPDRLGAFPAATLDVCIAAEILMRHLQTAKTDYGGAVEVVQVRGGGTVVFVVATSGPPAGLDPVLGPGDLNTLSTLAQSRLGMPCSFIYANSAYDFYLPMNADFLKLFEGITKGFNPPKQWVKFSDVQGKLDEVLSLIEGKQMASTQPALEKGYRTKHSLPVRATASQSVRTGAIKDIAACALALHMNACGEDQVPIRLYFKLTLLSLDLHAAIIGRHWEKEADWVRAFVGCARALAKKTQDVPADLTRFTDDLEEATAKAFKKYVEMKSSSLFCAEPRAFAAIGNQICSVHGSAATTVVSQACFCLPGCGRACPGDYVVEGTLHGSWCYMWPCKSCKARSSFMMAGLNVGQQTKRTSFEAP